MSPQVPSNPQGLDGQAMLQRSAYNVRSGFLESAALPQPSQSLLCSIATSTEKLLLFRMAPSTPHAVGSVSELRRALKCATVGTGRVRELIESCPFDIGISGFTTLIATCGKRGHCEKAMEIFEAMELRGIRPNVITLTSIITVFASAGRCDMALQLFVSMKELCQEEDECRIDTVVYRSLIPALAKAKRYREVFELFDEMVAEGFEPNRRILMALVRSLSDTGRWSDAAEIIESMHFEGIAATRQEYAELIAGCCRVNGWDYTLEIFLTMQLLGVDVDSEVCGALMQASEKCERPDMGIELLSQMEKFKIEISLETYNCLLRSLARKAQWEESLAVFRTMRNRRVKIDKVTAATLVSCCASAGKAPFAMELKRKLGNVLRLEIAHDDVQGVLIPAAFPAAPGSRWA